MFTRLRRKGDRAAFHHGLTVLVAALVAVGLTACTDSMLTQTETALRGESSSGASSALSAGKTSGEPDAVGSEPLELTWGDGELWELLSPHEIEIEELPVDKISDSSPVKVVNKPSAEPAHAPLYVIAPQTSEPQSPGHGNGIAHDHVIPVPPQNEGTYSAEWHVLLVINLNTGRLAAETPDGDPLTSVEHVEEALEADHIVAAEAGPNGTEFVFTCPVRPHNAESE